MEPIGGMEYQLFLPKNWNAYGSELYPVVVFLHGHSDGKFSVMNSQSLPRLLSTDQSTSFDSRKCWCLEDKYSPLAQEEGTAEGVSVNDPAQKLDAPLADCDFADTFPAIVVMPQGWLPHATHTGWEDEHTQMQVFDITKHVLERFHGDPSRVVLTGQSQGSAGAWAFAARHSDLWSAVNPICGPYSPNVAASLEGVPVWVVGSVRDGTSGNDAVVEALRNRARGEVRYTRYLNSPPPPDPAFNHMDGHGSYDLIYRDPRLWMWAFDKRNAGGVQAWGLQDVLSGRI
jgi:predicted peptidase